MNIRTKKIAYQFLAILLLSSVIFGCLPPRASADYNANYLISDAVFTNSSSMSQSDIQNFLASKNSGLTNYKDTEDCGDPSGTHYAVYAAHYSCGQYVLASQIIYDAAQVYKVSPRAILATLQKEQSLVTTPNPVSSQLNCAMGYHSCGGFVGFFTQVDNGAWDLSFLYQRAAGNNSYWSSSTQYPCASASTLYSAGLFPGNNVTFYDPGGTAETITLATASTAALYCYTPYVGPLNVTGYSGSYNFVYWFDQWWGSTTDACGTLPTTPVPITHTPTDGDYNANGSTDLSIYRPSDGCWHINGFGDVDYGGQPGDIPVPGDYNGDAETDIAIYRPSEGGWHVRGVGDYAYGQSTDIPVPGDYTGNGVTDIAVYRPSDGTWHIRGVGDFQFGEPGDIPVPGDYTGNGVTDIAVYRPTNGGWYVRGVGDFSYGASTDIPVPDNYGGGKLTDIAVFRPSDGTWHVRGVGDYAYGQSGDIPVPGDYNGAGPADIAVYRPSSGGWHVRGIGDYAYGTSTDVPTVQTLNALLLKQYGLISGY